MAGVTLMTGIIEVIPSMAGSRKSVLRDLESIDATPAGNAIGKSMGGGIGRAIKGAVGAAVVGLGLNELKSLGTAAVDSFANLEDSSAAAGVVFGNSMGLVISQSKNASKQLGLSQQDVISAANTYGTYGKSAGLAGDELAKFSTDFTTLAGDMASFKGTSTEQAIEAIGAALRGETEPIRAYGVMLDDASMRQKALELGIISTTKDALTPQQKILAAQALIYEQTGDAQGDFARTSQSTANIAKTLSAETENLSAKFGQVLAPAFTFARVRALEAVSGVSLLLDKVLAFQDGLGQGALTPDLVRTLGLDPGNGFGLVLNEGIGGLRAFGAAWKANDGDITSSGFPGWMEGAAFQVRGALDGMKTSGREFFGALSAGDFQTIQDLFGGVVAVARPAAPIMVEVGKAVGGLSTEIGGLVAGALPLAIPLLEGATGAMNYLAEHTGVLTGVIIALGAGYVGLKVAQAAANVADVVRIPLLFAQAAANRSLASAIRAQTAAQGTQTAATSASLLPHGAAAATVAAGTAATNGLARAQGVATVTTGALGFAIRALPFVGLVALLATAVVGLVAFFTKTETGRAIIGNVWSFIQGAIGGVVSWFSGTAAPMFHNVVTGIGTVLSWLNTNIVQPVFTGVRVAIGWMTDSFNHALAVATPVFSGIGVVLNGFWLLARGIFQVVVSVIRNIVMPAISAFWTDTVRPVFDWAGAKIQSWWSFASTVFGVAVTFLQNVVGGAFRWFRDGVISPVFDWIGNRISLFWTGAQIIFGYVTGYLSNTFGPAFTWLRDRVIGPVFDWIGGHISNVWNDKVKPVFGFIKSAIDTEIPKAFELGKEAIRLTWNKIEGIAKAPVKFVVETVLNGGLIKGFNVIADILPDVDRLPDIKLPNGFARGGIIPGVDTGRDSVLTPMRPREGVLVPEATDALGHSTIHALNAAANRGGIRGARNYLQDAAALGAPMPGSEAHIWGGPQMAAARSGQMHFRAIGGFPGPMVARAAGVWNGLANVTATGGHFRDDQKMGQNMVSVRHGGMANPNWIGYYQGNEIAIKPGGPNEMATLVHEIGHALGLNHNTGNTSVMHPYLGGGGGALWPTAYDAANLSRIYGPSGAPRPIGDVSGGDGGWFGNPLDGLLDGLVEKFRATFKDAGIFGDLAIGIGKFVWDKLSSWAADLLPFGQAAGPAQVNASSVRPTVYDGGGWLHNTGGAQLVQHNKARPDAVLEHNDYRDMRDATRWVAERAQEGDTGGKAPVVNVYPRENHSEQTIATMASRKIMRKMRKR